MRFLYSALASPFLSKVLKLCAVPLFPFSLYGAFIEPYRIKLRRIPVRGSDPRLRGMRIAHISDLHLNSMDRRYLTTLSVLRKVSPHLICISGDSIDSSEGLSSLEEFISALSAPLGVFACSGNHDSPLLGEKELFESFGYRFLVDEVVPLEFNGCEFWLAGLHFLTPAKSALELLSSLQKRSFQILLVHSPDIFDELAPALNSLEDGSSFNKCISSLVLCGHTHGGQICLPFHGAVLTASKSGKRYEFGVFRSGETLMNVTRGIGTYFYDVRFLCPPEVCLIELI